MKKHTGEKSNKCSLCDYASYDASNLRTHMKKHTGEKSNKCNQHTGEKSNSQAGNLKTHIKRHNRNLFWLICFIYTIILIKDFPWKRVGWQSCYTICLVLWWIDDAHQNVNSVICLFSNFPTFVTFSSPKNPYNYSNLDKLKFLKLFLCIGWNTHSIIYNLIWQI